MMTDLRFGFPLRTLALLTIFLLLPVAARAQQSLVHDCGTGKLRETIDSFTNKTALNTLTINGNCSTEENSIIPGSGAHNPFTVAGFTNLTIKAGVGGATLSGPTGSCTPGSTPPSSGVLSILDSQRVALENIEVIGERGLTVSNSRVLTNTPGNTNGNKITGSHGIGVTVMSGGILTLAAQDLVADNCGSGILASGNSQLVTNATVRNNRDIGVNAFAPASLIVGNNSEIHDNGTAGVGYTGPGRVNIGGDIHHNGFAPVGNPLIPGGVRGTSGAALNINNANIHDNAGSGVNLRLNGVGTLSNTRIQFNSRGGLNLLQGSVAELNDFVGPNIVNGNGGGNIGDVNCDNYSQVFGNVAGVAKNKCPLQGRQN